MKSYSLIHRGVLMAIGMGAAISCYAGVEGSGGADTYAPTPAWFMSLDATKRIRTCTQFAPDFGVERSVGEATLTEAFKKWGDYLITKRIQVLPRNYIGGHDIYATQLELLTNCDGSEDLKVYFGAKDARVLAAKAKYVKPYGFVERTSGPDQDWGKGFMYIATPAEIAPSPAWTTGSHLLGILLHEAGHILGNSHLDGTVMAADIGEHLKYSNERDYRLEGIDGDRELRTCIECGRTYEGMLVYGNTYSAETAFTTLTGKAPRELTGVRFIKKNKVDLDGRHGSDYNLPEGKLIFTDRSGSHSFAVKSESSVSTMSIQVPLFLRRDAATYSYGRVFLGSLGSQNGEVRQIVVNVNTNGKAFEILLQDGNHVPQTLFISGFSN